MPTHFVSLAQTIFEETDESARGRVPGRVPILVDYRAEESSPAFEPGLPSTGRMSEQRRPSVVYVIGRETPPKMS